MERIAYLLLASDGRINRLTWLALFVLLSIAESVSGSFLREIFGWPAPVETGIAAEAYFNDRASFLAGLIFLWPSVAVDVKRWHDMGKSGWLTLAAYGPALVLYAGEELKNAGVIPDAAFPGWIFSLIGLVFLVYLIFLAARKGSSAANRFGAAP